MRRILAAGLAAALAACGSVDERPGCTLSTDCPVGQYCAQAEGDRFCWADGTPPQVTGVTASCQPSPCVRDGTLRVVATVTDDAEVLGAAVTLDLGGPAIGMEPEGGGTWAAAVPLRRFPFEAFERDVVATVTAQDGARNASPAADAAGVRVTRLRWERTVDVVPALDLSPPAVMSNGTVVLGGSNARLYFIAPDGTDAVGSLTVGSGRLSAAPAIGERAIWVGSEDFNLYGVKLDGTGLLANVSVNTGGAVRGSVAVRSDPTKEWAFGASESRRLAAVSTAGDPGQLTGATEVYTVGPVIDEGGNVRAASATGMLRSHTFDGAFTLSWAANVGTAVAVPIALDGAANAWTGSQDTHLFRTTASGSAESVASLPTTAASSAVILANGDVLIGDTGGALHRLSGNGTPTWTSPPALGGPALSPLVLAGGGATFLVPTMDGTIHALRDDGSSAWWHTLAAGVALRPGNIHTQPGQSEAVTSTAYFSAANGRLYAVVVDGQLDASAPWPKAFHDPRNTNRAGPQP